MNNKPNPLEDIFQSIKPDLNTETIYKVNNSTIVFHDDVTSESADSLIKLLHQLDDEKTEQTEETLSSIFTYIESENQITQSIMDAVRMSNPIHLYVSTSGGDVVEAFRIINAIERLNTPVFAYADGMVASAGVWILISAAKRFSFAHCSFMLHNVLVEVSGDYNNVLAKVKHTDKLQEYLYDMLLTRTKLTKEKIDHIFKYDYFFDPKEALDLGIIDEILGKEIKKELKTSTKRSRAVTTTKL